MKELSVWVVVDLETAQGRQVALNAIDYAVEFSLWHQSLSHPCTTMLSPNLTPPPPPLHTLTPPLSLPPSHAQLA